MKTTQITKIVACGALLNILAACGGSNHSDNPSSQTTPPSTTATTSLAGTVASGAPLSGVAVTAYEANGNSCGTAITATDGTYVMKNINCTSPFLLEAQTANGLLVSPWVGSGVVTTMNVTPLTTGLFFGSIDPATTTSALLQALSTLDQAQLNGTWANITADMNQMFPPATYGVNWSTTNPVTSPLDANHTLVDLVLDNLGLITPSGSGTPTVYFNTSSGESFSTTFNANGGATASTVADVQPLASSVVSTFPNPVNYVDFNYQDALASTSLQSSVITDKGVGVTGSVTFGLATTASSQSTATFTPTSGGNYSWGTPIAYANGFDSNSSDSNVPAVAMICKTVAGTGTTNQTTGVSQKSTDVLIPANATQITQASDLIGVSFNRYYEDCLAGGTSPATTTGNYLSFDGQGNATFTSSNGSGAAATTIAVTASQLTGALTSAPVSNLGGQGGNTVFAAFRYVSAYGLTRYALVERGTGNGAGYIGIWLQ